MRTYRHDAFVMAIRSQVVMGKHTEESAYREHIDDPEKLRRAMEENYKRLFGTNADA